jgi:7-carboxy-7-deazaguanine synthase
LSAVLISEIFYSVQGEGSLVGVPSIFIRTSGCNLRCSWCDTPYASWQPEGEELSIEEIAERIAAYPASHVVVTGGEPMIAPSLGDLSRQLRSMGLHITIETAGTVFAEVECDLMSISPKLANSTPHERDGGRWAAQHERLRWQPEVIRRLMGRYPYQLKFVIAEPGDAAEVDRMCSALGATAEHVVLMPEGRTRERIQEKGLWLAEICKTKGYRYSPRLHIDLWGDRRGV